LVATAVAAIHDGQGAREIAPDLRRFRVSEARCAVVHVEAYRNEATRDVELARWVVTFHSDVQPSLAVEIDRRTGIARAYRELREFGYSAAQLCAQARSRTLQQPGDLGIAHAAHALLFDSPATELRR
jgi:hypothetical protein